MKKVTVIIPAYNAARFIKECLDSLINQTYKDFDVIIVNDGSTDKTELIIKEYQEIYDFIELIKIENHGQGYARNLALKKATGDYIMFLDADDFIEPKTLEKAVEKIEEENSDLVIFDWKYYHNGRKSYMYNHWDRIFGKKRLTGQECIEVLGTEAFYTVCRLYRKDFLYKNKIRYMERYIYEDIPFWVKVAINAKNISIINQPFYNVRISATSTTKTKFNTDIHATSLIKAIELSIQYVKESKYNIDDLYLLYKYFVIRYQMYYEKRVPDSFKRQFTVDFLKAMKDTRIHNNEADNRLMYYLYKLNVFKKEKIHLFKLLIYIRNIKHKIKNQYKRTKKKINTKRQEKIDKQVLNEARKYNSNIILFSGFDYRYTGNSRYLFEELIAKKNNNVDIYYVTEDVQVAEEYRVEPNSIKHKALLQQADILIFESWIPLSIRRKGFTVWIQLWHGTPLKKMLFDSNEMEIVTANPKHKMNKYSDMKRWNYFIVDNPNVQDYFKDAFLLPDSKIIPIGYPRVKYLIENKDNKSLKAELRKKYNFDQNKKIVSYLPTWRDYNYGNDDPDYSYLMDVKELQHKLGDEYLVVQKAHTFLNSDQSVNDIETQELLLISDYLITDYSSVMFDAFAINLKTIVYANDYDKYKESRDVYEDIWKDLEPYKTTSIDDVVKMITDYKIDETYNSIKDKYTYKNAYNRNLSDMLIDYFDDTNFSPFIKRVLLIFNQTTDVEYIEKEIDQYSSKGYKIYLATDAHLEHWKMHKLINNVFYANTEEKIKELETTYQIYKTIYLTNK